MSGYPRRGRLTDEQVVKIRLEYARGYKSAYQLGREYEMTQANITAIVQGSFYRTAGGLITWPGQRLLPEGKVRGRCWDVACMNPIASSGWPQRMHMCERCFRLNGGKKCGRVKSGRERQLTCRQCHQPFTYYVKTGAYRPRTCSQQCGAQYGARKRVKRPPDLSRDRLYELYWGQDLTTAEIAAKWEGLFDRTTVVLWLKADAIQRRPSHTRRATACVVLGCHAPIHTLWNGHVFYGRLCREHLNARSRERARIYESQRANEGGANLLRAAALLLSGLPADVKAEAEQEIVLAALSQELALPLTKESVKPYIVRAFRENANAFQFLSLAAPTSSDEGAQTWGERLGLS